jgi:hypothetical protein
MYRRRRRWHDSAPIPGWAALLLLLALLLFGVLAKGQPVTPAGYHGPPMPPTHHRK